jgi:hypothetical protein
LSKQAAGTDLAMALNDLETKAVAFLALSTSNPIQAYTEFARLYSLVLLVVRRGKPVLLVHDDRLLVLAGLRKVIVSVYNCNLVAEAQTTQYPTGMGKGILSPLKERIETAILELRASILSMSVIAKDSLSDDASCRLIYETTVALAFGLEQVLLFRRQAGQANAVAQKQLQSLEESIRRISSLGSLLAVASVDDTSRDLLLRNGEEIITIAKPFFGGVPKEIAQGVEENYKIFQSSLKIVGTRTQESTVYLQDDVKALQKIAELLQTSDNNNPALVLSHVNSLIGSIKKLEKSGQGAIKASEKTQSKLAASIATSLSELKALIPQLIDKAKANASGASKDTHSKILATVEKVVESAVKLANNTLAFSIGYNLQYSSKLTAAVIVGLSTRVLQR